MTAEERKRWIARRLEEMEAHNHELYQTGEKKSCKRCRFLVKWTDGKWK